jgi:type I restriction enzyme S subunit
MTSHRVKLGSLGSWGSGGTPLASQPQFYGGDIPWLIIEDLNDGVVSRSARCITPIGLENSSAKIVPPGTLLIAMYGSIGKLGITGISCATNQAIAFCKCDPAKVDTKFLFFFLLHERAKFLRAGRGGTQQNISQEYLKNYEINLPSLGVQQRIARQLEQADKLCHTRRYALQMCDEFLPAVFIAAFGDPRKNPNGYAAERLGKLLSQGPALGTTTPCAKGGQYLCVRVGEIGAEEIDYASCGRVNLTPLELTRYTVADGDILLARAIGSADHLGKLTLAKRKSFAPPVVHDSHVMRVRTNPAVLLPTYLASLLRTAAGRALFMRQARRTAVQFNINSEQMEALTFPVPPVKKQKRFETALMEAQGLRTKHVEALRQADHLFQTLLHQAFSIQQ